MNPQLITCIADQWTLVATNVLVGVVHISKTTTDSYYQTYRLTGDSAPVTPDDGIPFKGQARIKSSVPIDVYIWSVSKDGIIRIDL